MALYGSTIHPLYRSGIIAHHAMTIIVAGSEVVLRRSMTRLGSPTIPHRRHTVALLDTRTPIIAISEVVLRSRMPRLGRLDKEIYRLLTIALHANTMI